MPAQTAHISRKPCQISSSLVLAAKRDGSQNMQPANTIASTNESARKGRLSIALYTIAIMLVISYLLARLCLIQRAQAPAL